MLLAVAVMVFANKVGLIRFYALAAASAVIGRVVAAAGVSDVAIEKTCRGRIPLTLVRLTEKGAGAYRGYRARFKKFLERT